MKLVPLAGRPEAALRDALLSHGWEGDLSRSTSLGTEQLAYHLTDAEAGTLEALVGSGSRLGLDVITGPDWAVLIGARARLGALARPWNAPAALLPLAEALGQLLPGEAPGVALWQTARGPLALDRPVLLGILNVTPDSFSDGGRFRAVDAALARAGALLEGGATIIDVGGESTRPGAAPVDEAEELTRVIPVIEAIAKSFPGSLQSVDTTKAGVARRALEAGAAIINDVSGLRLDAALAPVAAAGRGGLILSHSRGAAGSLASLVHANFPGGVLSEVTAELAESVAAARSAGVAAEQLVVDPGLGFGKTADQNIELLRGLGALRGLGRPILVGPSRKRFLGSLTGREVQERDVATAAACALAWANGARLFRVHEPGPARDALAVAQAICPP